MNPEVAKLLKGMALFRDFTEAEVETLLHLTDPVEIAAGECIVRQDENGVRWEAALPPDMRAFI